MASVDKFALKTKLIAINPCCNKFFILAQSRFYRYNHTPANKIIKYFYYSAVLFELVIYIFDYFPINYQLTLLSVCLPFLILSFFNLHKKQICICLANTFHVSCRMFSQAGRLTFYLHLYKANETLKTKWIPIKSHKWSNRLEKKHKVWKKQDNFVIFMLLQYYYCYHYYSFYHYWLRRHRKI